MAERLEFVKIEVKDFINQYFYRYKILENEFEKFKESLINYIEILEKHRNQNEDFLVANCLSPFFKSLNFETQIKSKMKGKSEIDLSIVKDSNIQIIIEAKKPNDKDFFGDNSPNCKALHEAILYYFRIREENNFSIKYIILTDFYKFYIFEAKEFEKVFYRNKDFEMLYKSFKNQNSMFNGKTEEFYLEAKNILERKNFNLKGTFVDLSDILNILQNDKNCKNNFKDLKPYFKIFSRDFLLQEFNPNDANELNKGFYDELLHILGLSEKIINNKTIIVPSKNSIDREGTLYYNILQRLPEDKRDKKENEINEKVLEILIIWINRILFLKLLESSLINFNNDKNLGFLNIEKIKDYNKLNYLFFNILAKNKEDRNGQTAEDLAYLPYLNSSLFTRSEKEIIDISQLSNLKLEYFKNTQIKDGGGHSKKGKEDWLKMIFEFLNSFDFGARDDNENILAQKDLINSSVLGLVFEKLNGYKEGSFYTPSFITSYMCKESLEKIVLQKFRENGLNADNLDILQKQILANMNADFNFRDKAINILEEIRICDPAVGSGHFLVSALNETVYIYYKLGLLNIPISDLKIENDEILIKDLQGKNFEYFRPRFENDNHKIQRELFNLKKSIIENNLFGVDINNNSCEITKLRLWIELLKNSYYLSFDNENYHNLQTLPNIDINIKCGNSLISYFDINQSLNRYPNIQDKISEYKELVKNYKDGVYDRKSEIDEKIKELLESFRTFCLNDKFFEQINKFYRLCREYNEKYGNYLVKDDKNLKRFFGQENLFINEFNKNEAKKDFEILVKKYNEIYNLEAKSPFEWRFAFPEILNDDGDFIGFDLIIGNPPYMQVPKNIYSIITFPYTEGKDTGKQNTYKVFIEQAYNLSKEKGEVCLITQSSIMCDMSAKYTRELILKNTELNEFIEFPKNIQIFSNVKQGVCILNFKKYIPSDNHVFKVSINNNKSLENPIFEEIKQKDIINFFPAGFEIPLIKFGEMNIINKIKAKTIFIKELFIKSAQGNINTIHLKRIQSKKETNYFIAKGANVHRYYIDNNLMYAKITDETTGIVKINRQYFLLAIQNVTGTSDKYRIHCCLVPSKIKNFVFLHSSNIVYVNDIKIAKFIVGVLNSKLLDWIFRKTSTNNHVNIYELETLPIPEINSKNKDLEDKIINKVDEILKIKNENFNGDVSEIEREIDGMVYGLYGLTGEEIKIIENKN